MKPPTASESGRPTRLPFFVKAPATTIVAAHYATFALFPAIIDKNPESPFIATVYACLVASCAFGELFLKRRNLGRSLPQGPSLFASKVVYAIGLIATCLAWAGGSHNYAVQLGRASQASWVALATPFTSWLLIGIFLILAAHLRGESSRRTAIWAALIACGLQFGLGIAAGLVGSAASFTVCVLLVLLITRVLPVKNFSILIIVLLIAWPTIQQIRNEVRVEVRGSAAALGGSDSSLERLWVDKQLDDAKLLRDARSPVEPPSWLTVIRTGILPSALDGPRPPIDTGSRMSVALGGSPQNSTSATMPGNILLFDGWPALVAFYALLGFFFSRLIFSNSAWLLALGGMSYLYFMSFSASYPDSIVRILNAVVSIFLAAAFTLFFERTNRSRLRKAKSNPGTNLPHGNPRRGA
ncbi:hypothetical protein IEQ44_09110 [Nocardioides sp. Y6]|uniref:O-antigen ligase domain-containing protein n=1 Tax=Nocardioides malaquae TaxID=2773426 RepID=A0ABR9RUE7_9ACTN|nr:hypothetical protein [Nocardioides malaquae]MBE7324812.1 hypothetical protein [Nocardioides malaquae]